MSLSYFLGSGWTTRSDKYFRQLGCSHIVAHSGTDTLVVGSCQASPDISMWIALALTLTATRETATVFLFPAAATKHALKQISFKEAADKNSFPVNKP